MEFAERLSALGAKVRQQREVIQTEEATKNAFVMPFISTILGYVGCLGVFGQRISGFSTLPWPAAGNYSGLHSAAGS